MKPSDPAAGLAALRLVTALLHRLALAGTLSPAAADEVCSEAECDSDGGSSDLIAEEAGAIISDLREALATTAAASR